MTDIQRSLARLRRPRLLVRAARCGAIDYNRNRDLKRVLKSSYLPSPRASVSHLLDEEARIEEIRKTKDAAYSARRHVDVLIALMAEIKLLPPTVRAV